MRIKYLTYIMPKTHRFVKAMECNAMLVFWLVLFLFGFFGFLFFFSMPASALTYQSTIYFHFSIKEPPEKTATTGCVLLMQNMSCRLPKARLLTNCSLEGW